MSYSIDSNKVSFVTVIDEDDKRRVDNFLFSLLKDIPHSLIYRLIRSGNVRINKHRTGPDYKLNINDVVRIPPIKINTESNTKNLNPHQSLIDAVQKSILFEDEYILILNKPSGIPVHGGSQTLFGVIEILRHIIPHTKLELAHRIDQDTSGCLLLAKKKSMLRELHELFRNGKVDKRYIALTKGHWPKNVNNICVPLEKNTLKSGEWLVRVDENGKTASTDFTVVELFTDATLVSVKLYTGRTHQIRVHSQFTGHNIAGDEKYADKPFNASMKKIGLKRLFLHAAELSFHVDSINKDYHVVAPLDEDLSDFLNDFRNLELP